MKTTSAIAVYFIVWWVCLFMVLPFGVKNAHETGETVEGGNEAGAPVNPMLWRKIAATTLLASVVFAAIYGQITYGWIAFEDLPFMLRLHAEGLTSHKQKERSLGSALFVSLRFLFCRRPIRRGCCKKCAPGNYLPRPGST